MSRATEETPAIKACRALLAGDVEGATALAHAALRQLDPQSVLSLLPDAMGFYYGFIPVDPRRIDVQNTVDGWIAYVGGDPIGTAASKEAAEVLARHYMRENPPDF